MGYFTDNNLKLPTLAALTGIVLCFFVPSTTSLFFKAKDNIFEIQSLINIIAPAFICSLFIERAAEGFILAFRRANRVDIENRLMQMLSILEKATTESDVAEIKAQERKKKDIENEYKEYRRITVRIAFSVTIAFSAIIASLGIRVLAPFLSFLMDIV